MVHAVALPLTNYKLKRPHICVSACKSNATVRISGGHSHTLLSSQSHTGSSAINATLCNDSYSYGKRARAAASALYFIASEGAYLFDVRNCRGRRAQRKLREVA